MDVEVDLEAQLQKLLLMIKTVIVSLIGGLWEIANDLLAMNAHLQVECVLSCFLSGV